MPPESYEDFVTYRIDQELSGQQTALFQPEALKVKLTERSGRQLRDSEENSTPRVLKPGEGTGFTVELRRLDGEPFDNGTYVLVVENRIPDHLSFEDGSPWKSSVSADYFELLYNYSKKFIIASVETEEDELTYLMTQKRYHSLHGENEEALQIYLRYVQLAPEDRHGYAELGSALMRLRRYREAIVALEKTMPVEEKSLTPYHLAFAYYTVGMEGKARQVLGGGQHADEWIARFIELLKENKTM